MNATSNLKPYTPLPNAFPGKSKLTFFAKASANQHLLIEVHDNEALYSWSDTLYAHRERH
jgi:hypothetical protein